MALASGTKAKKYRVISKYGEAKNGVITIYINGERIDIPENEATELSPGAISFLTNAVHITHKETGADEEGAVDIEKGFSVERNRRFELMEV